MKKTKLIILTATSLFLVISCNIGGSSSDNDRPKTPEELRMELQMQEQSSPTLYLFLSELTMKNNLVKEAGLFRDAEYDGSLVEGVISNSATIAKFKDIVLTIQLLSQTGTVIEEKDYVIYEFYEPNATKSFSIKIYPPDVTKKFNVSVKSASAID